MELAKLLRVRPVLNASPDIPHQGFDKLGTLGAREVLFTSDLMKDPLDLLGIA